MPEENDSNSEYRGEKVPYQPSPPPTPLPKPVHPKKVYEAYYIESSPETEWDESHDKHMAHHYHILKTLHKSKTVSERTISLLWSVSALQERTRQIQLLDECSDACGTCIRYISRSSPFSGRMAKMCARVCDTYHRECSHYSDSESQMTAQVLLKCAKECRNFALLYKN